ncbi:MAG: recombination protein RecR [Candidatus Omnitrophica bacterium]|nr:recombination protein RecR [Candidatus Omnitrophota bacterium]
MGSSFPRSITVLIDAFSKMPGIGKHSARRLTFYILKSRSEEIDFLLRSISEVKRSIRFCSECNNLSDKEVCDICSDSTRDTGSICVVSGPNGVMAMEKSGRYKGLYHVLLGELSPIDGVGPEDIKINELVQRIKKNEIKEVVIATDFTTEGETTALYLLEKLRSFKIKVSRLARGVPAGAIVEYADMETLQRAFEERTVI